MRGNPNPCYQNGTPCPQRVLGCHGSCERYARYYNANCAREAEKASMDVVFDYITMQQTKRIRREHKRNR